jgi:hypothetical protein
VTEDQATLVVMGVIGSWSALIIIMVTVLNISRKLRNK